MITPGEKLLLIDDMIDAFKLHICRIYKTEHERLVAADVLLDDIKVIIGSPTPIIMDGNKIHGDSLMDDS